MTICLLHLDAFILCTHVYTSLRHAKVNGVVRSYTRCTEIYIYIHLASADIKIYDITSNMCQRIPVFACFDMYSDILDHRGGRGNFVGNPSHCKSSNPINICISLSGALVRDQNIAVCLGLQHVEGRTVVPLDGCKEL